MVAAVGTAMAVMGTAVVMAMVSTKKWVERRIGRSEA
jgi:hypothetical protein